MMMMLAREGRWKRAARLEVCESSKQTHRCRGSRMKIIPDGMIKPGKNRWSEGFERRKWGVKSELFRSRIKSTLRLKFWIPLQRMDGFSPCGKSFISSKNPLMRLNFGLPSCQFSISSKNCTLANLWMAKSWVWSGFSTSPAMGLNFLLTCAGLEIGI